MKAAEMKIWRSVAEYKLYDHKRKVEMHIEIKSIKLK